MLISSLFTFPEVGGEGENGGKKSIKSFAGHCTLWQYGLWSFQTGGTKLERFLPKKQHTQSKFLNFKNWCDGEMSKSAKI